MSRLIKSKQMHRHGKKANLAANNYSFNEQDSSLTQNMNNSKTISGAVIKSPLLKFQRHKSNPIPKKGANVTPKKNEKKRDKKNEDAKPSNALNNLEKILSVFGPTNKKKKVLAKDSSLKQFENSSSLLSDEFSISPKLSLLLSVPNVPEQMYDSISPKLSPILSGPNQIYEQSVNKHGDVVDYAVPYSEEVNKLQSPSGCEDVDSENALNKSIDLSDIINELDFLSPVRSKLKITDLDKSSDGSRSLDQSGRGIHYRNNREVFSELDSLECWSQNIRHRHLSLHEAPINKNVHVIECKQKDIKSKFSVLKNTVALPLHFSSGVFRTTPVTVRKCCPRDEISVGLVEEAIERDYYILNQVKHPNIILLMAASFHRKTLEHMTLVLEPADYTLNYFLHQMDTTLSLIDCISVVQQIANAALYLQECGFIHSNISSHNVLVRESPWCVKLTSFELTTEVDFADTRSEIIVANRHNFARLQNGCADTPQYAAAEDPNTPLKEKYKQLSRLLPVLKCSPDSKHKCLRMASRHLIYDSNYRQHLSLHNFQAPELLTTKRQFVFPTIKADVYSLCLVLWEMLNKCVPFVVYNKLDMERMITSKKLSLPFFERERCAPFMSIFRIGLAMDPHDRAMDVQQLMRMLEDVKLLIQHDLKKNKEQKLLCKETRFYVNTTPQKTVARELSPNLMDFDRCLDENELTSTKKKRNKAQQQLLRKNTVRQLFNGSEQEGNTSNEASPDDIDILRQQSLDEIKEESESLSDSIVGPVLVKEAELPSTMSIEKQERRKTSPEMEDLKVKNRNHSDSSKSCSNLFDASILATRKRLFDSNNNTSPMNDLTIGVDSFPDTPIARKNKILRDAWLKKALSLSIKEINDRENRDERSNVSMQIVHSKVTPKKLVSERIRFFDSMETSVNIDSPIDDVKISNKENVEKSDSNYSSNHPKKDLSVKEITELATDVSNRPISNSVSGNHSTDVDKPRSFKNKHWQRELEILNRSFGSSEDDEAKVIKPKWRSVKEKILKFEKRCALDVKPSTSLATTTELVRNLSTTVTNAPLNTFKFSDVPTLIKRSVYTESIVSGVNLSSFDSQLPIFDQLNLTGQKLTTKVTLNMRQIRRRSSDLDEAERRKIEEKRENSQTICGSQKGLIAISKEGTGKTKYICSHCASKMSQYELKALTLGIVTDSSLNATDPSFSSTATDSQLMPNRRCQVRVTFQQNTRSIEDLYIDDDFDQGVGANIELQSDCSDFLNFDVISEGI